MLNYIYLITLNYLSFIFLYKLSLKYNFVDKPNSRKKHLYPTPLIGGLIIYLNLIFSIYLFEFPNQINLIIIYSGIIIVTGFLDDFYNLTIGSRLLFIFLSCFLLINENLIIVNIGSYYDNILISLGSFSIIFTILCVAGLTNAFNFLDGHDGLLISQTFISYLLLFIFSFLFTKQIQFINYYLVILINLIMGFLYNFGFFSKKKIFLGDAGSMFFGFSMGFLLIFYSQEDNLLYHPILVIWVIAFPIIDFVSTITRRIINGKNPFILIVHTFII